MKTEPIVFPILYRFDCNIAAAPRDIVKVWGMKHLEGNRFSMRESRRSDQVLRWLIDFEGNLREATVIATARGWMWGLRPIYEISPGRVPMVRDLLTLAGGANCDPEKSCARSFLTFLSKFPPDAVFTRLMFLDYMGENPDHSRAQFS